MLRDTHGLSEHIDNRYDEGAETDTAKGVGHGPTESAARCAARHTAGFPSAEEPGAVDPSYDAVNGILEPFRDPIGGKGHKDDQAYDFGGGATSTTTRRTGRISAAAAGLVFDVDGNQSDRKPCPKGHGDYAADRADEEDVAEAFGYVHGLLEHDDAEWDSRNPTNKADDAEDTKQCKNNGGRVITAIEIVDACADTESDV